jgi:hypothetical protein
VAFVFPAIDFAIYGLPSARLRPRWLEELDFQYGREGPAAPGYEQVFVLWLGHGSGRRPRPDDPWVLTGSIPIGRFGRIRTTPGDNPVQAIASTALWHLVGRVMPELNDDLHRVWNQHVVIFIEERATLYESWSRSTWSVDGTPTPARVFHWAGAWTGFVETPEVAVIVVASAVNPEGLALTQILNGDEYHFEIDAPFDWPSFLEVSQLAAFQEPAGSTAPPWPHHVDHQELLTPG